MDYIKCISILFTTKANYIDNKVVFIEGGRVVPTGGVSSKYKT